MLESYPEILTSREVGELLSVCDEKLYRMLKTGEIPAVKIGRDWRISRQTIARLMEGPPAE